MTITEKLARIQNRSTLYELVAVKGDRRVLVCYCGKSVSKQWRAVTRRGAELVSLCGVPPTQLMVYNISGKYFEFGEWRITLSGRTQREAIIAGEHLFICDVCNPEVSA